MHPSYGHNYCGHYCQANYDLAKKIVNNAHAGVSRLGNDEALGLVIEAKKDEEKLLEVIADIKFNPNNWIISDVKKEGHEITRIEFKPIDISPYCGPILNHCDKTVMMSATILDKDAFCATIGLAPEKVKLIQVGSDFPVWNRPIYPLNIAPFNYTQLQQDNVQKSIARVIDTIMTKHSSEHGIIHTTSYKQLNFIRENISQENRSRLLETGPEIERNIVITEHRNATKPTVLISPSLYLGLDLKDDLSRF